MNSKLVLLVSHKNLIAVYDILTQRKIAELITTLPSNLPVRYLKELDSGHLLVASLRGGHINIFSPNGKLANDYCLECNIWALTVTRNGSKIWTMDQHGTFKETDWRTGKSLRTLSLTGLVSDVVGTNIEFNWLTSIHEGPASNSLIWGYRYTRPKHTNLVLTICLLSGCVVHVHRNSFAPIILSPYLIGMINGKDLTVVSTTSGKLLATVDRENDTPIDWLIEYPSNHCGIPKNSENEKHVSVDETSVHYTCRTCLPCQGCGGFILGGSDRDGAAYPLEIYDTRGCKEVLCSRNEG